MKISQYQARLIAECVAFDIKKYIEEHRLEYEEWKQKQKGKEDEKCEKQK